LSGGPRQRLPLARPLATPPRPLLHEQPLSPPDPRLRNHLREQSRRIHQELGHTTVFVTHEQEQPLTLSDRTLLM
ncbi:spermidine/putrescine ABC transporter ATP-binding protein, partial [Pseudomonas aeruginosa]